jgi:hypothetical protein
LVVLESRLYGLHIGFEKSCTKLCNSLIDWTSM